MGMIIAKYESSKCKMCGKQTRVGDSILFMGKKKVFCDRCAVKVMEASNNRATNWTEKL